MPPTSTSTREKWMPGSQCRCLAMSTTATQLSLNGGVGKRIPMQSNAWRVEGFLRYNFENAGKGLPSRFDIGARLGMSFWR